MKKALTFDQLARVDKVLAEKNPAQQDKILFQWVKTGVIQLKTFQEIMNKIREGV